MPAEIDVATLEEMLERGAVQLIEVLPRQEYEDEHLPGALSIPLKSLGEETVKGLDPALPTVVYCWDDA